jgi:hypothetical protein
VLEPPRDTFEELLDRSPRLVSTRAAVRFALLTRDAKPAKPLDEDPDFDASLAIATCLTRTGEWRRDLLIDGPWSLASSSDEEDKDTLRVAFFFPFRERGMGQRQTKNEGFCKKRDRMGEREDIYMNLERSSQVL